MGAILAMERETFDVVDHSDNTIGTASRKEVHDQGLLHRSAHLLIFNSKGDILLQRRSESKDSFPGRWDSSVSGHVDSGESYDECIVRETWEEIGLELSKVPEKLFKIAACEETAQEFCWVYREFSGGPFSPNSEEVSDLAWFAKEEVARLVCEEPQVFSPSFCLAWKRFSLLQEF